MGLPEWCQTHSFKEFLELTQENIMDEINVSKIEEIATMDTVAVVPATGTSTQTAEYFDPTSLYVDQEVEASSTSAS